MAARVRTAGDLAAPHAATSRWSWRSRWQMFDGRVTGETYARHPPLRMKQ